MFRYPIPKALRTSLAAAQGTCRAVRKRRELFLYQNGRIQLDKVEGLGEFLELKAVLDAEANDAAGHAMLRDLIRKFNVQPEDLLGQSYGEMVH